MNRISNLGQSFSVTDLLAILNEYLKKVTPEKDVPFLFKEYVSRN